MGKSTAAAVISGMALLGCHTITEELPTRPSQNPDATPGTVAIALPQFTIPVASPAPTPKPSPTPPGPTPTTLPAPTPTPTPPSEPEGSCTNPTPGPISRMDVKIHIVGANRLILDSTPLVGPDAEYCKKIGFTDGRRYCPTRVEGSPERFICDEVTVGNASDTGRIGPTWTLNGQACVYNIGCENHPDNQFLVFAYVRGTYQACTEEGACGSFEVK